MPQPSVSEMYRPPAFYEQPAFEPLRVASRIVGKSG